MRILLGNITLIGVMRTDNMIICTEKWKENKFLILIAVFEEKFRLCMVGITGFRELRIVQTLASPREGKRATKWRRGCGKKLKVIS